MDSGPIEENFRGETFEAVEADERSCHMLFPKPDGLSGVKDRETN